MNLNAISQNKKLRDFFLVIILCLLVWHFSPAKVLMYQFIYDVQTRQQPIQNKQDIDRVLRQFETIPIEYLDSTYLDWTKITQPTYQKILKNTTFYRIPGKSIFQFLVGDFRVKQFLPQDDYYQYYIQTLRNDAPIYFLIQKELLYKLLALQEALEELGYRKDGFDVINGFRHPAYNEKVGGASKSRHILGEALDLRINDINGDGRRTQKDKQIVLDLLDKHIIKDKGGIGRYPGTMSVHFDVRGYKARWDKQ